MKEITNDRYLGYYNQRFAVVGSDRYFRPGRDAWVAQLQSLGFEARSFEDYDSFREYSPTCVIVFGITQHPKPNDHKKIWVAVQTEQFYHKMTGGIHDTPRWLKKSLPYLKKYDIILDFSATNAEAAKNACRALLKKPILVHPFCCFGEPVAIDETETPEEKIYDICFVGWHSRSKGCIYSRRDIVLNALAQKYKVFPPSNDLWGEEKQKAIRQSKICLNLHQDESRVMETARLIDYFSNRAFVLSDRIYDPAPFVDGEDFVSFFLTNIEQTIDYYLSHDEKRQKIADAAFEKTRRLLREDSAVPMVLDAVLMEADRKNYPREMRSWRRRRLRYRIHKHLPEKIRDKIM